MRYPNFPIYVSDFLTGTMHMTSEEVGGYFRLLLHQWDKECLPQEKNELQKLSGIKSAKLETVLKKFDICDDGKLRNKRLEKEREKIAARYAKLQQNGASGGRPPTKGRKPEVNQMVPENKPDGFEKETRSKPDGGENQNQNQNQTETSVSEARAGGLPTVEQVAEYFAHHGVYDQPRVLHFFNHYEAIGWMINGQRVASVKALVGSWLNNPIGQAQQKAKAGGRTAIMDYFGNEVPWTEAQLEQYNNNPNASGYTFLRYEA